MKTDLVNPHTLDQDVIHSIVLKGDMSGLSQEQAVAYYNYRCQQVGLDPSAKPFDLLTLNGKKLLYANAGATQQLCAVHKLSVSIINRERFEGVYLVSVRVTGSDGRVTENDGAVELEGERIGKANALMKATTKAIRRTVLAHCGLGMLDETEVETIPNAVTAPMPMPVDVPIPKVAPAVEGKFKVMIPDGEGARAYSSHADEHQWHDNFFGLIGKIASNTKISTEEKNAKLASLFRVNAAIYGSFSGVAAIEFKKRCHDHEVEAYVTKKVVTLEAEEDDLEMGL
jgi:hypothetical protein